MDARRTRFAACTHICIAVRCSHTPAALPRTSGTECPGLEVPTTSSTSQPWQIHQARLSPGLHRSRSSCGRLQSRWRLWATAQSHAHTRARVRVCSEGPCMLGLLMVQPMFSELAGGLEARMRACQWCAGWQRAHRGCSAALWRCVPTGQGIAHVLQGACPHASRRPASPASWHFQPAS